MKKNYKKPKKASTTKLIAEQIKRNVYFFLRTHFPSFNQKENEIATYLFKKKVIAIKEVKSQQIFYGRYVPLATEDCIKHLGFIPDQKTINSVAHRLFFDDINAKKLDEFYNYVG